MSEMIMDGSQTGSNGPIVIEGILIGVGEPFKPTAEAASVKPSIAWMYLPVRTL
jgi:hypothetical protein